MNAIEAKLCQGKDVFERMNYLYQASQFIAENSKPIASYYGSIMTSCAKKAVLRMEPDIKRTICKTCQAPLLPGKTSRVRLVSKPVKAIKWTCLSCSSNRKIPLKKGYKLWTEDPESLLQVYDYAPKETSTILAPATKVPNELLTDKNQTNEIKTSKPKESEQSESTEKDSV